MHTVNCYKYVTGIPNVFTEVRHNKKIWHLKKKSDKKSQ